MALRAAPTILVAVLLHALAFVVWDVGSRPPSQLLRDIGDTFSRARRASLARLRSGLWRFALGWAFLLAGATLMLGATVVDIRIEFTVLEVIAILSGLLVEALVGPAVRTHLFNR